MVYDEQEETVNKFNKARLLSTVAGIHNLTPPSEMGDDGREKIAVIESLKVSPRLKNLYLEILGLEYDEQKKELIQVARPIMNKDGAYRFVKILKTIAEEIEYSYYSEDEINKRILLLYEENFPHFTLWSEEFELDPMDFNYISTKLMIFIDSSFHKAKNGKYINSVARMYDERFLGNIFNGQQKKSRDDESFLSKLNPFKRK